MGRSLRTIEVAISSRCDPFLRAVQQIAVPAGDDYRVKWQAVLDALYHRLRALIWEKILATQVG